MLFQVGDFFELFYEDAERASEMLGLSKTKKAGHIPMCGFPVDSVHRHLHRLVRHHGQSVAICEQVEDAVQAKEERGNKALVERQVVRLVTPGTVTEDTLLSPTSNNFLAAICTPHDANVEDNCTIGLAFADISTGSFHTLSSSIDALEGDLARYNPSEIVLPENDRLHAMVKHKMPSTSTLTLRPAPSFEGISFCQLEKLGNN